MRGADAYGLVSPLVTMASGAKFGKTEAGTVWLDPVRTSPFRFYQFWINTDDRDVVKYLKFFTWLDRATLDALDRAVVEKPGDREAQRTLALLDHPNIARLLDADTGDVLATADALYVAAPAAQLAELKERYAFRLVPENAGGGSAR